ncbi:MAG: hypothetical protein R2873_14770 [Caldilineaceae bacterium]
MPPRFLPSTSFPVRLPQIRSFSFASGSAGKAGGTAPHVFVKVTADNGARGLGRRTARHRLVVERRLRRSPKTLRRYPGPGADRRTDPGSLGPAPAHAACPRAQP